ncbi:C40 family peptidase [Hamadaea tsunoensis]|uniref:C40 family peptidase n=1 Tax=Hamadaea tsunoensis TaxID=53368 RepID=UPI0003FA236E|nr:C40 family peptidase [Hamadaea tsunoensis]
MTRRGVGAARLSALLTAAIVSGVAGPAHADPASTLTAPAAVPDAGARPVPDGNLAMPLGVPAAGSTGTGLQALTAQLNTAQNEVMLLGEQLNELRQNVTAAQNEVVYAQYAYYESQARLDKAKQALADAASSVYEQSAGLPDFGLSGLHPNASDPVHNSAGAAHALAIAQDDFNRKRDAYDLAVATQNDKRTQFANTEVIYKQRDAALTELKKRNATQVALILQQEEQHDQQIGSQYLNTDALQGMKADPRAISAVRFALNQLGKSYVWGDEGPDHYDCSGLVWAAYRSVGQSLPRVSRDQFQGTKSALVSRYALLPGDLLFFSSSPYDEDTIHHVGIYLGDGKMVHSPTTGDVVKVSTVWWSHFYAATRVFPAIQVPTSSASPTATATPTPTPSSTGSPAPHPTGSTRPDPSRSTRPSSSSSPSGSPSPDDSSSPSAASSPDAGSTAGASATAAAESRSASPAAATQTTTPDAVEPEVTVTP